MDRYRNLLIHPPLPPALNMAVDWWLTRNLDEATVRFYRWDRPALSLGYRQQQNLPSILDELSDLQFVVRPTGGGYLYHEGDLSISYILPDSCPITDQSIKTSYRTLTRPLIEAVRQLDLVDPIQWGNDDARTPNCLDSPSSHEPTEGGTKWMAAAQVRREGALLQQGTLFWRRQWPDALDRSAPRFLKRPSGKPRREVLRNRIIRQVSQLLFESKPLRHRRLNSDEWGMIHGIKENFSFNEPGELPVFDRYGTPLKN